VGAGGVEPPTLPRQQTTGEPLCYVSFLWALTVGVQAKCSLDVQLHALFSTLNLLLLRPSHDVSVLDEVVLPLLRSETRGASA
jgi:hypothetical protein